LIAYFALSTEEVCVILEGQLEDKILLNGILNARRSHTITKQWKRCQWNFILIAFIEEEAKLRQHDPKLLPS
jgi:hypothetical protein